MTDRDALAEFDLAIHSRIDIGAPAHSVWPYLARPDAWKPSVVSVERLAGAAGEEGETLRLGQRPADVTVYTIMRTVRAVAPTWLVQTLQTEDGRSTSGYVVYSLDTDGARTRVVCDVVARCRVPLPPGTDSASFAARANEATRAKLDADHERLRQLVERAHE